MKKQAWHQLSPGGLTMRSQSSARPRLPGRLRACRAGLDSRCECRKAVPTVRTQERSVGTSSRSPAPCINHTALFRVPPSTHAKSPPGDGYPRPAATAEAAKPPVGRTLRCDLRIAALPPAPAGLLCPAPPATQDLWARPSGLGPQPGRSVQRPVSLRPDTGLGRLTCCDHREVCRLNTSRGSREPVRCRVHTPAPPGAEVPRGLRSSG